ncbi:MAG: formylglycine-generating enzyme family protein [bacterium]|nr:formylglycine-generating enzyme family protein [bacterium]
MQWRRKNVVYSYLPLLLAVGALLVAAPARANNVAVSNVTLQNIDTDLDTVEIKFDLAQDNAFGDLTWDSQAFSDYVWIVVKYGTDGFSLPTWGYKHATLASGGTITPTTDNLGAFVKSSTATTNMTLVWDYGADSVADDAIVKVKVLALETVKIPEGQFTYNAGGIGGSGSNNYGGGAETDVTSAADLPSGAAAGWPNGYGSFYLAKYEVSQGQYADFLNMLGNNDASSFFSAQTGYGHTITYTAGNAYGSRYAASVPNRGNNYMSTADSWGYAAWLATRPMTEMEFEKAGRGTNIGTANTNTYPWGNGDPDATTYSYNDGSGAATYVKYFANYSPGVDRPYDVGHFLRGDITRTNAQTGASPYGVADLAGNDWEWEINSAATTLPLNGVGSLTVPASWPATNSANKGVRGGGWYIDATYLRVSGRSFASDSDTGRNINVGFRPARTN